MKLIDADKLEPMEVGIDEMSFLAVDYDDIKNAPTIKTKQIKYFDEDEKVWKIGEVIDNE